MLTTSFAISTLLGVLFLRLTQNTKPLQWCRSHTGSTEENLFFPFSQQKKNQSGFLAIWCSAKIQHTQFLLKVLVSDFYLVLVCSFKLSRKLI